MILFRIPKGVKKNFNDKVRHQNEIPKEANQIYRRVSASLPNSRQTQLPVKRQREEPGRRASLRTTTKTCRWTETKAVLQTAAKTRGPTGPQNSARLQVVLQLAPPVFRPALCRNKGSERIRQQAHRLSLTPPSDGKNNHRKLSRICQASTPWPLATLQENICHRYPDRLPTNGCRCGYGNGTTLSAATPGQGTWYRATVSGGLSDRSRRAERTAP